MDKAAQLDHIRRGRTDLVFEHLRLALLVFDEHRFGEASRIGITSDHGAGWGNGMERKLLGDYLPESAVPPE